MTCLGGWFGPEIKRARPLPHWKYLALGNLKMILPTHFILMDVNYSPY